MITKKYSSPCARFYINVKIDKKQTQLSFDGYDTDLRKRTFETNDYEIQKQLEASPDFGLYFHLQEQSWDGEKAEVPVIAEVVQDKEFKNSTEARDWLYKVLKVPITEITNKFKMVEKAKELGYNITFKTDLK
jgi:hypothetical protein